MVDPQAIVGDEFRCPTCGHIVFHRSEPAVNRCPHLVYAFFWSDADPDSFLFARLDFAQRLVDAIRTDPTVRGAMEADEIIVWPEDCDVFLSGSFQTGDRISALFGSLPVDFHRMLEPTAILYCDDGLHGGLHLVVEGP